MGLGQDFGLEDRIELLAKGYMTREQLDEILKPEVLTKPHYSTVHKPRSAP